MLKKSLTVGIILLFISSGIIPVVIGNNPISTKTIYVDDDSAPDFTLTDIHGINFTLSDNVGKVVLINFMATWSNPCYHQILELVMVYENFSRLDLEMISVDIDIHETAQQLQSYIEDIEEDGYEVNWTFAIDTAEENVGDKYQVDCIPTIVIVDRRGHISYRHEGIISADELITEIEKAKQVAIYVDDDNTEGPWDGTQEHPYQHIQDGVINANNGDIIFVNSGFYHENVNIDKPITLIGADVRNTTIDGDKSNHAVFIKSNSVKISGFTIQEGYTGILVANSSDISINDNFIIDNIAGVAIRWNSNNNSVYNNEIRRNKNIGVLVDHVKREKPNSFLMNNFIDNGKNAIAYGVKCQWSGNFWDDWIGLKFSFLGFFPYLVNFYPLNFDMNPASEPYDI